MDGKETGGGMDVLRNLAWVALAVSCSGTIGGEAEPGEGEGEGDGGGFIEGESESESESEAESEAEAEAEAEAESEAEAEGCAEPVECPRGGACQAMDEMGCPLCFWGCLEDADCPGPAATGDFGARVPCFTCDEVMTKMGPIGVCRPKDDAGENCRTGESGMPCNTAGACADESPCYVFDMSWTVGVCSSGCEAP